MLFATEWLKLTTTPTARRMRALAIAAAIFLSVSYLGTQDLASTPPGDSIRAVQQTAVAGVVMFLFGAISATAEFRYGTLPALILLVRRRRQLAAHLAVIATYSALAAAAAFVVSGCTVGVLLSLGDAPMPATGPSLRAMLAIAVAGGALGAIGFCLGATMRSQPAAVGMGLAFFLAVEPLAASLSQVAAAWSPTGAVAAIIGVDQPDLLRWPYAALALTGYVAVVSVVAFWLDERRDIV